MGVFSSSHLHRSNQTEKGEKRKKKRQKIVAAVCKKMIKALLKIVEVPKTGFMPTTYPYSVDKPPKPRDVYMRHCRAVLLSPLSYLIPGGRH